MKLDSATRSQFCKVLLIILSCFVFCFKADECGNLSAAEAKNVRLFSCCNNPYFVNEETARKVHDEVGLTDPGLGSNFLQCNYGKKLLEHEKVLSSNGIFDIEAAKSSLRRHVEDQEWLGLYENALPLCINFSENNCETIQRQQKHFSKDQCNVKYIWMLWCMDVYGIAHCSESSLNSVETCNHDRELLKNCFSNSDFLNKIECSLWGSKD